MDKLRLDEKLDKEIEGLFLEGGRLVYEYNIRDKGDLLKAIDLMQKSWDMLPSPKEGYSPSFHITENLTKAFIGLQQFDEAKKWLEIHKTTGLKRIDSGEKDLLEGEFFYAQGELENAKSCFQIANKKSGGRLFQRKDRKHFKELLSKEDIRPTSLAALLKAAKKEINNQNYGDALDLLYDAFNLNQMKVEVNFNKGLCHFELGEFDHAADSFARAYMLDGDTIFNKHDVKYFEFLKTKIEIEPKVETTTETITQNESEIKVKPEETTKAIEEKPKKKPWWKF